MKYTRTTGRVSHCTRRAVLCVWKNGTKLISLPFNAFIPHPSPVQKTTRHLVSRVKKKKKWTWTRSELPFARHFTRSCSQYSCSITYAFFVAPSARPYFPLLPLFPLVTTRYDMLFCFCLPFSPPSPPLLVSHDKSTSTRHYATARARRVGAEPLSITQLSVKLFKDIPVDGMRKIKTARTYRRSGWNIRALSTRTRYSQSTETFRNTRRVAQTFLRPYCLRCRMLFGGNSVITDVIEYPENVVSEPTGACLRKYSIRQNVLPSTPITFDHSSCTKRFHNWNNTPRQNRTKPLWDIYAPILSL